MQQPEEPPWTEHQASTVDDVLNVLLPRPRKPAFDLQGRIIYRGMARASWSLVPGALRDSALTRSDRFPVWAYEWASLHGLVKACDQSGVQLPGDSPEFRDYLRDGLTDDISLGREMWPPQRHWLVWAAAQHHGLPTRLLDWTLRPLVATYFAAEGVLNDSHRDGELRLPRAPMAIWALRTESLNAYGSEEHGKIRVVTVAGATSPNLAAQSGIFTLVQERYHRGDDRPKPVPTIESVLARSHARRELRKVVIPAVLAPELIDLCADYGVSASSLFPGMDGAIRQVKVESLQHAVEQLILDSRDSAQHAGA